MPWYPAMGVGMTNSSVHRSDGVLRGVPLAGRDRLVGLFEPIPALVAVHRVIAAANGGDFQMLEAGNLSLKLFQIADGRFGRRVAAVEKGVNRDGHPRFGEDPSECGNLVLVRMDPAGRHEPD